MRMLAVLCGCTAASVAAGQGTLTYSWTFSDTGNGDGIVEPGEAAVLSLWALMEPGATGFAGSIFEIWGNADWQQGVISRHDNLLDDLSDDGTLNADNSITGIEAFQLPPAFNPSFDASNPIKLYEIEWSPDAYRIYSAEFWTQNHLNNDVYVDDFGTSVPYDGVPAVGTIAIIPGPGTAGALAIAAAGWMRRRR